MNIGIDMIEISRFIDIENNKDMMNDIFTKNEQKYITSKNNNAETISGIYAAKEALLKAIKKDINKYKLNDIEINHDKNNAPYITLYNDILNDYKDSKFEVSISHDIDYVVAVVIDIKK